MTQKKEIVFNRIGKGSSQLPGREKGSWGPWQSCRALAGDKEPGRGRQQSTSCQAAPGPRPTSARGQG